MRSCEILYLQTLIRRAALSAPSPLDHLSSLHHLHPSLSAPLSVTTKRLSFIRSVYFRLISGGQLFFSQRQPPAFCTEQISIPWLPLIPRNRPSQRLLCLTTSPPPMRCSAMRAFSGAMAEHRTTRKPARSGRKVSIVPFHRMPGAWQTHGHRVVQHGFHRPCGFDYHVQQGMPKLLGHVS